MSFWVRVILFLTLVYLGYRLVAKLLQPRRPPERVSPPPGPAGPEELVQDPVCLTFIPRREALKVHQGGQDYFFCSEGCLKRFHRSGKT